MISFTVRMTFSPDDRSEIAETLRALTLASRQEPGCVTYVPHTGGGQSGHGTDSESARRRIEEESIRMTGLVDDLLVLARLDQGRPLGQGGGRPARPSPHDAVADARVVAPQRVISLSANGPVIVTGDDTRLRQVLGNLVRNAIVHTPQQTPIEVAVATDDGLGRMSVADHGPGLATTDVARIFEPFYRADPSRSRDRGGAGLGLSIVSAVVTAHGGHVKVSQDRGRRGDVRGRSAVPGSFGRDL